MRTIAAVFSMLIAVAGGPALGGDQEILAPDLERISEQTSVIEAVARERFQLSLSGGEDDLVVIQRIVDEKLFEPTETYQLQSLGIVLGSVLSGDPDLSWVTVRDEYGTGPALRYKSTSILIFPLTMISKRVESDQEVDVRVLYDTVLARVHELESEAD